MTIYSKISGVGSYVPPKAYTNFDIEKMIEFGVKIVGGCCETTPNHIHKIRRLIDSKIG